MTDHPFPVISDCIMNWLGCFLYCSLLESMVKYFSLVLAGLAGSPRMASCTLLSLSKLVFEFHGENQVVYHVANHVMDHVVNQVVDHMANHVVNHVVDHMANHVVNHVVDHVANHVANHVVNLPPLGLLLLFSRHSGD